MERQRWNQERRRKQPSLYDEYLNQERTAHQVTSRRLPSPIQGDATTIRAVTPDSIAEEASIVEPKSTNHFERDFLLSSQPSSSSASSGAQSTTDGSRKEHVMGEQAYAHQSRRRTRTLETTSNDNSQSSAKSRMRMGSLQHTGYSPQAHARERPSSKSQSRLASSVSQPVFGSSTSSSQLQPGLYSRPGSDGSTAHSLSDSTYGALPSPNARRILHLMKTLCGRMSGNVSFRRPGDYAWTGCYCYTQEETGALVSEPHMDAGLHKTLVPDLRGCHVRCAMDQSTQTPYLEISAHNSNLEIHMMLNSTSDLDSWFAALLCWQPIRPKGIQNRVTKSQASLPAPRPATNDNRQLPELSLLKEAPVIKVGIMIFWESNTSFGNAMTTAKGARPQALRMQSYSTRQWRRVSCTLRENGELKLYTESENTLLSVVQLSQLSRCAVQRLDPSVLENDFCMAIYPQYTSDLSVTSPMKPIFLSVETRILYEVWFVLLRAFTIPQLYGPKLPDPIDHDDTNNPQKLENLIATSNADMFRMERSLSIRIIEAKLQPNTTPNNSTHSPQRRDGTEGHYVEVHLDGETRAKTQVKREGLFPFWRQDFDYHDLPAVLSSASVFLKHRPPDVTSPRGQQEPRSVYDTYAMSGRGQPLQPSSGYTGVPRDTTLGKVEIFLEELEGRKEIEKWWPVSNSLDQRVGEILIRARAEENVILMARDYEPLSQLLHRFGNQVTVQIALSIPPELRRLSDCLLNIFQVSGQVTNWLTTLVEDEIDGLRKETPMSRLRYSRSMGSTESEGTLGRINDRELVVRDLNKNAALEANLLFRGNTILTKSLDTHMRRVGSEYLAEALGPILTSINNEDPDCEVDPNKVANAHEMQKNWTNLKLSTAKIWQAIQDSAQKCPVELKLIFRHIRACAEDRYGDFLRSVTYSSVSGFLFLRFFCPAVLNPKLFGLLKDDPKPRARRSFTLIAKSLQGLANMASFGTKEHWMEPMNVFLNANREAFKSFIQDVCFVPHPSHASSETPHSYLTPQAIKSRLPLTSREGFPSLPYLLDESRELASLVDMWLKATDSQGRTNGAGLRFSEEETALKDFHELCIGLHEQTRECLSRAERAERPTSDLSFRWEELIESLQSSGLDNTTPASLTGDVELPMTPALGRASRGETNGASATPEQIGSANLSPGRINAEREWETDHDGGAASAAATLSSQDRNPRNGFVLSESDRSITSAAAMLEHANHQNGGYGGGMGTTTGGEAGTHERPASALSGSIMSSDAEATALPRMSRERARRDRLAKEERDRKKERRDREKEKEKEKERAGLKDLMPGLGRRKKEK